MIERALALALVPWWIATAVGALAVAVLAHGAA